MRRFGIWLTAVLLAGGFLLCPPRVATAQGQGDQKAAEPQAEQKPPEAKPGDQKAAEQAAAEAIAREISEYKEAKEKLPRSAGAGECVWTGRRIESLLWRDDIDTARKYIELYDRFGCSPEHLKIAFRCIIEQGPIDPKAADRLASRVQSCWIAPDEPTTESSQATAGPAQKDGTVPN